MTGREANGPKVKELDQQAAALKWWAENVLSKMYSSRTNFNPADAPNHQDGSTPSPSPTSITGM